MSSSKCSVPLTISHKWSAVSLRIFCNLIMNWFFTTRLRGVDGMTKHKLRYLYHTDMKSETVWCTESFVHWGKKTLKTWANPGLSAAASAVWQGLLLNCDKSSVNCGWRMYQLHTTKAKWLSHFLSIRISCIYSLSRTFNNNILDM